MDCPKTSQTSATRPAQMPATSQRSEILSRISQAGIAEWSSALIKIELLLDLNGEVAHALSVGLLQCVSRRFDRFLELAGLRISGGKCSNENRIGFFGELIRFGRELHRDFVGYQRIIRAGRHHPGEIVERKNGFRLRLQRLFVMIDRFAQQTFLDKRV